MLNTLKPSDRIAKAARIRAALSANPNATLEELRRLSFAGQDLVREVRRKWLERQASTFSPPPA